VEIFGEGWKYLVRVEIFGEGWKYLVRVETPIQKQDLAHMEDNIQTLR
jgi:hypothetical protein